MGIKNAEGLREVSLKTLLPLLVEQSFGINLIQIFISEFSRMSIIQYNMVLKKLFWPEIERILKDSFQA